MNAGDPSGIDRAEADSSPVWAAGPVRDEPISHRLEKPQGSNRSER